MSLRVSGLALKLPILSVLVTLALLAGSMQPTTAWASDGEEEPTGFLAGLDSLVNPDSAQEIENDPVRDYEYEPILRDVEPAELDDEATTMDSLSSVITACNSVQAFSNQKFSLLDSIVRLFTLSYANGWLVAAVGIVFMWWGVRVCINMIMGSFRRGKLSIGGRESVAPQGWSTRDLDKWKDF